MLKWSQRKFVVTKQISEIIYSVNAVRNIPLCYQIVNDVRFQRGEFYFIASD